MKAILVIPIDYGNYDKCIDELRANIDVNLYGDEVLHYNNMSLKPLPDYKLNTIPNGAYARGWDDCIDEILGEEE